VIVPSTSSAGGIGDWVELYDNIGGHDGAGGSAFDGDGNVLVTGSSLGQVGALYSYEYATLKYDPQGNLLWTARYNGPGTSFNDTPSELVSTRITTST
jgi:hypothetical protein